VVVAIVVLVVVVDLEVVEVVEMVVGAGTVVGVVATTSSEPAGDTPSVAAPTVRSGEAVDELPEHAPTTAQTVTSSSTRGVRDTT
jgi:hypothetical protein